LVKDAATERAGLHRHADAFAADTRLLKECWTSRVSISCSDLSEILDGAHVEK
jgi:hypothetical protein